MSNQDPTPHEHGIWMVRPQHGCSWSRSCSWSPPNLHLITHNTCAKLSMYCPTRKLRPLSFMHAYIQQIARMFIVYLQILYCCRHYHLHYQDPVVLSHACMSMQLKQKKITKIETNVQRL